jgi:hypothetical protein
LVSRIVLPFSINFFFAFSYIVSSPCFIRSTSMKLPSVYMQANDRWAGREIFRNYNKLLN